jgi:RHS repeat-associated protein
MGENGTDGSSLVLKASMVRRIEQCCLAPDLPLAAVPYNSLLQLTRMTATQQYGAKVMDMQYNYSAAQNNGRITSSNDYVTGENVSYSYHAVNRLTGASAGSMWGETYSYDGFGNLTGKTVTQAPAPALGVSYDANNHQLGLSYDANGNQLADAQYATNYDWDMENRLVASTSNGWPGAATWYVYDPWGKRVMKDVNPDPRGLNGGLGYAGGAWEFYFYSITGQKLVTASCSSVSGWMACGGADNVYFGGKVVKSRGNVAVTDRLGSVRYSVGVSYSYFPYGEERTVTSDDTEKFGTYLRDGPGQDYAEQRYYNNGTGRFWSADPYRASASLSNPQTWNRYAYVHGDPINFNDPTGEDECAVGQPIPCTVTVTGQTPDISSNADRSVWGSGNGKDMAMAEEDNSETGVGGLGSAANTILNAERGADDRLFNPDCAGLFLAPAANTAANRAALSNQLDSLEDTGVIRQIDSTALPSGGNPNVPAFATGPNGLIYIVSGGAFFTGQVNGSPVGGFAAGMTLADFQQLIIIHEFLHYEGVAGPDNSGQKYTLPNGDTVKGSAGISKEVKKKCFN